MRHVERGHLASLTTPEHRPRASVLQRIPPDRRVEERDAHANHPVATIPIRDRRHGPAQREVVRGTGVRDADSIHLLGHGASAFVIVAHRDHPVHPLAH